MDFVSALGNDESIRRTFSTNKFLVKVFAGIGNKSSQKICSTWKVSDRGSDVRDGEGRGFRVELLHLMELTGVLFLFQIGKLIISMWNGVTERFVLPSGRRLNYQVKRFVVFTSRSLHLTKIILSDDRGGKKTETWQQRWTLTGK